MSVLVPPDSVDPAMIAAARTSVRHAVKTRARRYALQPMALDTLHPGLAAAAPRTLVAVAEHLLERERLSPRRWFGFGGEICIVNARAALLLGRVLRRRASSALGPDVTASSTAASSTAASSTAASPAAPGAPSKGEPSGGAPLASSSRPPT